MSVVDNMSRADDLILPYDVHVSSSTTSVILTANAVSHEHGAGEQAKGGQEAGCCSTDPSPALYGCHPICQSPSVVVRLTDRVNNPAQKTRNKHLLGARTHARTHAAQTSTRVSVWRRQLLLLLASCSHDVASSPATFPVSQDVVGDADSLLHLRRRSTDRTAGCYV
jgi:hypothetical protein